MKHFELSHIIDNEDLENRLDELTERYGKLNGWTEIDLMQFAINALPLTGIYLDFLDLKIEELEQTIQIENQTDG